MTGRHYGFAAFLGYSVIIFTLVATIPPVVPDTEWSRTYVEDGYCLTRCAIQSSDRGYLILAEAFSLGQGRTYSGDLILKTDSEGTIEWNRTYPDMFTGHMRYVQQTGDGGYILGGEMDLRPRVAWLIKTDSEGWPQWNRTYGGGGHSGINCVKETRDGGYVFLGPYDENGNSWLVRTDSRGNVIWNVTYYRFNRITWSGDPDYFGTLVQTSDGGYLVTGSVVEGHFVADSAIPLSDQRIPRTTLFKTDSSGNALWNKTDDGSQTEYALCAVETPDGGYVFAGSRSGCAWIAKVDQNGTTLWSKPLSLHYSEAFSLDRAEDGGYLLSEGTYGEDSWMMKIDSAGAVQWRKKATNYSSYLVGQQGADGSFVVAGTTHENNTCKIWLARIAQYPSAESVTAFLFWSLSVIITVAATIALAGEKVRRLPKET